MEAPQPVREETGGVVHLDEVPALADRAPIDRESTLPRWPVLAALLLVVVLAVVRIPTGRDDVQDDSVGEIPIPATPLPERVAYDLQWVPSDNTTVAVLGEGDRPLLAIRRYGPLDPIYASSVAAGGAEPPSTELTRAVDVTPDGLIISWDGDSVGLWSPALGLIDQIANGVTAAPALSPSGRLLAVPIDTAIFVYDIADAFPGTAFAEVRSSAVSDVPIEAVHWSPSGRLVGGGNTSEWVVFDARSGVTVLRGPGELLAVAAQGAAVRIGDGVVLQVGDNAIQRTWPELFDEEVDLLTRAEFSPDGQHLAIQSIRSDDQSGVVVLELAGQRTFRVGVRPGIGTDRPLAWSGNGRALYWLDGSQLVAWLASTRQTVLVAERNDTSEFPDRIHGIRIYDQALVPTGTLIARPAAPPTLMADGAVLTLFDGTVVVDREVIDVPDADGLTGGASIEEGDDRRWGAELADGLIAFEPGPAWTETSDGEVFLNGTSLTALGDQFMWIADGDLYSEASFPEPLLAAIRLGNGEIVAAVGVRDSLIVAFEDVGQVTQLWQVPAWSDALSNPLIANRGAALPSSPFTIAGTWIDVADVRMLRSAQQDAFTVTYTTRSADRRTTVFYYPEVDVSAICGVQLGACQGLVVGGEPTTFSPDGYWLLVDQPGPNLVHSTRGRGSIELEEETAIWEEFEMLRPADEETDE